VAVCDGGDAEQETTIRHRPTGEALGHRGVVEGLVAAAAEEGPVVVPERGHRGLESVATWHERDLTNSSLERIVFPDSCYLADFMLNRVTAILSGLHVFPDRMMENLRKMGDLVFSEHVMIALIAKGMSREAAYKVAQRNAAKAWDGEDFKTSVANDEDVKTRLTEPEVEELFSLDHHLRHARYTVEAVGIA